MRIGIQRRAERLQDRLRLQQPLRGDAELAEQCAAAGLWDGSPAIAARARLITFDSVSIAARHRHWWSVAIWGTPPYAS